MINIVTAPEENLSIDVMNSKKIFLAGGITGCSDWQSDFLSKCQEKLKYCSSSLFTIYNPRRPNFSISDSNIIEQQIVWEFKHLKEADLIIFWFAKETLNPIVLYELGMWGNSRDKNIIIGVDPDYLRKEDVEIQTRLARPSVYPICQNIEEILIRLSIYIESGRI